MLYNQTELAKQLKSLGYQYSVQRINKLIKDGRLAINDGMIDLEQAISLFKELKDKNTPGQQLTQSRAKKEHFIARQRELDVKVMEGKLLDRKTVEATTFKNFRTIRDTLLNIPIRIAPILAPITDQLQIELLIKQEIIQALQEFSSDTPGNGTNNHTSN